MVGTRFLLLDRGDGDWARYVTDEVIPRVAGRFQADARRVAIGDIFWPGYLRFYAAALMRCR